MVTLHQHWATNAVIIKNLQSKFTGCQEWNLQVSCTKISQKIYKHYVHCDRHNHGRDRAFEFVSEMRPGWVVLAKITRWDRDISKTGRKTVLRLKLLLTLLRVHVQHISFWFQEDTGSLSSCSIVCWHLDHTFVLICQVYYRTSFKGWELYLLMYFSKACNLTIVFGCII